MTINLKKIFFPFICLVTGILQIIFMCADYLTYFASYGGERETEGLSSAWKILELFEDLDNVAMGDSALILPVLFSFLAAIVILALSVALIIVGALGIITQLTSKNNNEKDYAKAPRKLMMANTICQVIVFILFFLLCIITVESALGFKVGFIPGFGAIAIAVTALITTIAGRIIYNCIPEAKAPATFKCNACGTDVAGGTKFCPVCGADVSALVVRACPQCGKTAEEGQAFCPDCGVEFVEKAVNEGGAAATISFGAIIAKAKKFMEEKNISKKTLTTVAAAVVGVIALIIIISLIPWGQSSQYVEVENDMTPIYVSEDDETVIIAKGKMTDMTIDGQYVTSRTSADGNTLVILDEEGNMYLCKKNKIEKIASDVTDMKLAQSGEGVAYINNDGELYLMNTKNKESAKLTDELVSAGFNSYVISPDGKTVAYADGTIDDFALYTNNIKGDENKIANDLVPLGISDGAKLIYYYDTEEACVYVEKGDEAVKLANLENAYLLDYNGGFEYAFNADHTQLIYEFEGKSYISVDGKDKVKIGSAIYQIGQSGYLSYNGKTTDILDFKKQYILDSNGDLYFLNKKLEAKEIASDVSQFNITDSGDVIYYLDDSETLYRGKGNGKDIEKDFKKVAFDVEYFVIDSDGKRCYYVDDSKDLYTVKKSGDPKKITSDVEDLVITHDDYALFITDDDTLFYSRNGGKSKKVADDIDYIYANSISTYYGVEDNGEYSIFGTKKKTKFDLVVEYED